MSRALNIAVPVEVTRAAATIKEFAAQRDSGDNWSVYGLGPVYHRDAELAALRAENAHLKTALALSDALRNKERNLPL